MEPSEFKITTIVYDSVGNVPGSAEYVRDRVAKDGSGPVVTYTFDPNGGILRMTGPDEPGSATGSSN